jgi:hypothetical protein
MDETEQLIEQSDEALKSSRALLERTPSALVTL